MKLSEIKWYVKFKIRLKKLFFIKLTTWEQYVYNYMTEPMYSMLFGDNLLTEEQLLENERLAEEAKQQQKKEQREAKQREESPLEKLREMDQKSDDDTPAGNPLYTFHTVGPMLLTYKYPVCTDSLKREILSERGSIGPEKYKQIPGAFEALKPYNNEFFLDNEQACNLLLSDLLTLLRDRDDCDDLWTIAGSVTNNFSYRKEYMKRAAEAGVKEGMVTYGIHLYLEHHVAEGCEWVRKGAELGDEIGIIIMGISYQFGTITKIDYGEAARWYKSMLKLPQEDGSETKYWAGFAAVNLGVLYADAGYFHTARKYFLMAKELEKGHEDDIRHLDLIPAFNNIKVCDRLLEQPYNLRKKLTVIQQQAPELDFIFCSDKDHEQQAPAAVFNPNIDRIVPFCPTDDELEPEDRDEKYKLENQETQPEEEVRFPFDSFVFPTYNVAIRNENVFDNKKELIFLEKNVHMELNNYIQKHFADIKDLFRKNGFQFVYLPAHAYDFRDQIDIMMSNMEEYGTGNIPDRTQWENKRNENIYWESIFSEESLPDDCAGFLQRIPPLSIFRDQSYRYIIFPHRPGTDWGRAFNAFIAFVTGKSVEETTGKKMLDTQTKIVVDKKFNITVTDSGGKVIGEVKMPTLSKILYFTYLRHPEGIAIKELSDYRDELIEFYKQVAYKQINLQSIDNLVDSTKNSANEKISRIKKAFETALGQYQCDISSMIPTGSKGERYVISFNRENIVWEPTAVTL